MNYDVVIIGSGPAGLSAAIYAARYRMKTIVLSKLPGGTATKAHLVENYPGHGCIDGIELMKRFRKQALKSGAELVNGEVVDIKKSGKKFQVFTQSGEKYISKSVILCLGSERRKLNIPGESEFVGMGVSYCTTCDATFFKGREVVVVGGSDSALKGTLVLKEHAKKVTIVYRGKSLRGEPTMREKVLSSKKVSVMYNSVPSRINGNSKVESISVKNTETGEQKDLKAEGVFIEIGEIPSTSLAKDAGVKLDREGYIKVDKEMGTNVEGMFAAGDVTDSTRFKQIITAAAQGSISAYSSYLHVKA